MGDWTLALVLAWLGTAALLFSATFLYKVLGIRVLVAVERLMGMLLVAICGSSRLRLYCGSLRLWMIYGCVASGIAMFGLAVGSMVGPEWPLRFNVFALGLANGAFSIAAIASMMRLAVAGGAGKEGVRIGLWGGAQAIAFGVGGLLGAAASDVARALMESQSVAYASVFSIESGLFIASAYLASKVEK